MSSEEWGRQFLGETACHHFKVVTAQGNNNTAKENNYPKRLVIGVILYCETYSTMAHSHPRLTHNVHPPSRYYPTALASLSTGARMMQTGPAPS